MPKHYPAALRRWAGPVAVLAAFAVVLALWTFTGRVSPDKVDASQRSSASSDLPPGESPSHPPSSSPDASPSSGSSPAPTDLPLNGQNTVDITTGAQHQVTITASSDTAIWRLLFYVRGGKPNSGHYTEVHSPVRVSTVGRADNGPIAEVWMQASVYATQVSCSISVDGRVRSTDTARGPHNVAICIA